MQEALTTVKKKRVKLEKVTWINCNGGEEVPPGGWRFSLYI